MDTKLCNIQNKVLDLTAQKHSFIKLVFQIQLNVRSVLLTKDLLEGCFINFTWFKTCGMKRNNWLVKTWNVSIQFIGWKMWYIEQKELQLMNKYNLTCLCQLQ